MATSSKIIPGSVEQNPSWVTPKGQDYKDRIQEQTSQIMSAFMQMLPSNYVSQVTGPFYTMQFQAIAERLAEFQMVAQEVFSDADYDFTRPEFLYQILGTLVFPDISEGIPQIDGDVTYRTFLKRMVALLLRGATKEASEEGVQLLTDHVVKVIEKNIAARGDANSGWGFDDQFTFEVDIYADANGNFPEDPVQLQENARLVLKALKPAHLLYDFRFVFQDIARAASDAWYTDVIPNPYWEMEVFDYEDARSYWHGAKNIIGTNGVTWTDRGLFSDVTRSFASVQPGASLTIAAGINTGTYRVREVRTFPLGDDSTARPYTTAPTGLSGWASVEDGAFVDSSQDFSAAVEGEVLVFTAGANAGSYRLGVLLGTQGGPVGFASGPATQVRPTPSILRLESRMKQAGMGQRYIVEVDRLGKSEEKTVTGEDVTSPFLS